MEAGELARWTRFAAKGGIGKCTALEDCVAQDADDLMFLKEDEITVLLQLPEEGRFLGYCEGVVGRFNGSQVHFHGKLKKPVLTKRDSSRASMTRVAASSPGVQSPSPVPRHSSMRTSDVSGLRVLVSSPSPSVFSPALKSLDNSPPISIPSSPLSNTRDETVPVPFHLPSEPSEPNSPPAHMFGDDMENTHERMIQQIEAEMSATLGEPIPRYISGTPPPHSTEDEEEGPNTARGQPLPLLSSPSFSRSFADHSMDPSEPSMRISAALSDGEVGIGLSLLNDLANGSDGSDYGDDDDDETDYNSWSDKHHTNDSSRPPSVSHHDQSPPHSSPPSPDSTIEYPQPPSPLPAVPSIPVGGTRSRASSRGSEVWEGGSDIYDDYRYSRYSMASRMSFQIGGGGGGTRPGTPEEVPPMPRPKFGSGMSASVSLKSEQAGEARGMIPPRSSEEEVPRIQKVPPSLSLSRPILPAARQQPVTEDEDEEGEEEGQEVQYVDTISKNRPPSLDLGNARSPLLRATFGSPEHSPALNSRSTFMSERSSTGTATTSYHSGSGHLISELRAHFEKEAGRDGASRDSVSSREPFSPTSRASVEFSGRAIVVEDEEGINITDTDGNTTVRDSVVSRNDEDDDDDASVYSTQDTIMSSLSQTNAAATAATAAVGANLASVSPLRIAKTNSSMSPTFPPSGASPLNSPTSEVSPSNLTVSSFINHQHTVLLPDTTDLERLPAAIPRPPRNPPPDAAATAPVSGPNQFISRTSIFLPHPNAPKPTASPAGPMYSRAVGGQQQYQQYPVPPLPSAHSPTGAGSVLYTMRVAATPQFAPNGVRLKKTIYGKAVADLLSANGPVLMSFANTPFTDVPAVNMGVGMGASANPNVNVGMGMGGSLGGGNVQKPVNVPPPPPPSLLAGNVSAPAGLPLQLVPGRAGALPRTVGAIPQRHASESAASSQHLHHPNAMRPSPPGVVRAQTLPIPHSQLRVEPEQLPQPSSTTTAVVIPTTSSPPNTPELSLPPDASPSSVAAAAAPVAEEERKTSLEGPAASTNNPLPRANFFPKAKAPRPRSRSFSGFNSTTPETELTGKRSFEEGNRAKSPSIVTQGPIAHSSSASVIVPPVKSGKTSRRPSHAPSPLSLPQNNTLNPVSPGLKSPPIKPPSSPLARMTPFTAGMEPSSESSPNSLKAPQNLSSLRHAASTGNLGSPTSPPPGRIFSLVPPPRIAEKDEKEDDKENSASEPVFSATHSHSPSGSSSLHSPKEPTTAAATAQVNRVRRSPESSRANTMSPPPPKQPPSKPPSQRGSLLSKRSMPNLRGKGSISSFRDMTSHETVQVKDTDFELVRPTMPAAAMSGRSSEDSSIFGSDGQDSNYNGGHHNGAGTDMRPPTVASNLSASSMNSRSLKIDPQALTEAHRQREVRWMTLISREPAAQARKSKRVKKMLLEGVPSSVRYPVWAHLTDSKAKAMKGVYDKFQKRGRVPATPEIERDIRKLHMEQAHTQDAQGSLITLLQAYMNMVPDIQYQPALTFIAGHLLSLAPEEDAFWIFICVMDTFMRPYFSQSSVQLEVDASLFSKSLETNDPALARKIFVDLGITPGVICRQWFPFMFSETLPADYLYRVWDIFLFEGVPFLMRIGMAILLNCRGQILEATGEQAVLLTLLHPPASFLPTPERFIGQALALRFKDDDFRKLRIKMEAQVKRQTQARTTNTATSSISLPRS